MKSGFVYLVSNFAMTNKYPIMITVVFFLITSYISFFLHNYWSEDDGIFYLHSGEEILKGNGINVKLFGASIGGPVLFGILNNIIHDGFFTEKLVSVLCGTGIVFFSYFIIRNVFNSKIAIIGQLIFALNPKFDFLSILALNELPSLLLISVSLFFITKKIPKFSGIVITSSLLGVSFMMRYQAIFVLISLLVFLLIRDRNIRNNLFYVMVMTAFFVIASSPIFIYNYYTYGVPMTNDASFYVANLWKYQTPQWHDHILMMSDKGILQIIFTDFNLFLKNYFYNLLIYNPGILFNFGKLDNLSIIPPIPFLGLILVAGGLIYLLNTRSTKSKFMKKNFLPLLLMSIIYLMFISIIPVYRSYHLLPLLFLSTALSALFLSYVVPQICNKIQKILFHEKPEVGKKNFNLISIFLILLILLVNVGFSYRLIEATLYDDPYTGILDEFSKLVKNKPLQPHPQYVEDEKIIKILSEQLDIKNSYVMAGTVSYAYYLNSKFVYTDFTEGIENETLNKWITRENWSPSDLYLSNINSYPPDGNNIMKPIPTYLIYENYKPDPNTPWHITNTMVDILADPNNPKVPSNFKVLYKSNQMKIVVYKIYPEH